MIRISSKIAINSSEIKIIFTRSSGPGGQHVNKVSTAAQLHFNIAQSASIPEEQRIFLLKNLAHKLTRQGEIVIKAERYRSQERNKQDALERLVAILKRALTLPKKRKQTKPSYSSIEKRLTSKRVQAKTKSIRRKTHDDES